MALGELLTVVTPAHSCLWKKFDHLPDTLNGDQPSFWIFGTAYNTVYYRLNVNKLGDLYEFPCWRPWKCGWQGRCRFCGKYVDDIDVAIVEAMKTVKLSAGVRDKQKVNNHAELTVPPWWRTSWVQILEGLLVLNFQFRPTQRCWPFQQYSIVEVNSKNSCEYFPSINTDVC